MIVEKLKGENINFSKNIVFNVINNVGKGRQAALAVLPQPVKRYPRKAATPAVIRKVAALNI
jgi:hypothetical protein